MMPAGKPLSTITQVRIVARPGANQNTATAIDIVFKYDSAASDIFPLTGPAWFAQKGELLNGLGHSIDVVSLLVQPAKTVDVPLPARHRQATAVYSYADYISPRGQAKGNLTDFRSVTIELGQDTVTYFSAK